MLILYRRHLDKCPDRDKGISWVKCKCPIWTDGELNGKLHRRSMKTRDWDWAVKEAAELESDPTKAVERKVKPHEYEIRGHERIGVGETTDGKPGFVYRAGSLYYIRTFARGSHIVMPEGWEPPETGKRRRRAAKRKGA